MPTMAQKSTKNRRFARSDLTEWLPLVESSRMWTELALFPWGDIDLWGPLPGRLNREALVSWTGQEPAELSLSVPEGQRW